jgi:anaerobic ribonucleoside-triphosphate reductase
MDHQAIETPKTRNKLIDELLDSKTIITPTSDDKIRHKVYEKVRVMFLGEVNERNIHDVVIRTMRELSKTTLFGFTKKKIAMEILALLLEECGVPHVVSMYSMEVIEHLIENIYHKGYHRKGNKCVIL